MRAKGLLFGLSFALVARTAAAEDLNLSWHAPAGCPSAKDVHDAALRSAPPAASSDPLDADVRIDHADLWRVSIRTKRAGLTSSERHLEATSCAALADATAVILSLALLPPEPDAPAPASAPAPAPAPASAPAPAPASESPVDGRLSPVSPLSSPPHSFALSASLSTDATSLPSPSAGARAALAWTPSTTRARLELAGSYFSSQSKTTPTSAAGAKFSLLSAGARGCWSVIRNPVDLAPCAGADVQMVNANGFGASQNYDAHAAWLSGAAGLLFRVPVTSWLAFRADADALVPSSRPRFVVEGDGAVHKPAAFGGRGAIGAELLFL